MSDPGADPAGSDGQVRKRIHPWSVIKGCGCVTATLVLGAAVVLASGADTAAIGAGLVGILILVLVVGTSGTNGWWSND